MTQKYNGWANRDTWLVALWLHNDEGNYKRYKDWTTKEIKSYGKDIYQLFHYGDEINWDNVDIAEIQNNMYETLMEDSYGKPSEAIAE